ncbi:MAG: hypothetical protein E6Q77_06575 [Rhizobium sp.]|nr:MAG: hypothetical protein E6Q77_06575 [Rhizobium sp.]
MNIYEVASAFKISVSKLRKLDKAGLMRLDKAHPLTDSMRFYLGKGKPLTVAQLVALVEDATIIEQLGDKAGVALAQVAMLGAPSAAPFEVVAEIDQAARGDNDAICRVLPWLKSTILTAQSQGQPTIGHHYLAVRLVLGSPASLREYNMARIARALLNCRRHPGFEGWWRVRPQGAGTVTQYGNFGGGVALDL